MSQIDARMSVDTAGAVASVDKLIARMQQLEAQMNRCRTAATEAMGPLTNAANQAVNATNRATQAVQKKSDEEKKAAREAILAQREQLMINSEMQKAMERQDAERQKFFMEQNRERLRMAAEEEADAQKRYVRSNMTAIKAIEQRNAAERAAAQERERIAAQEEATKQRLIDQTERRTEQDAARRTAVEGVAARREQQQQEAQSRYLSRLFMRMGIYALSYKGYEIMSQATQEGTQERALESVLNMRLGTMKFSPLMEHINNIAGSTPFSKMNQLQNLDTFSTVTNNQQTLGQLQDIVTRLAVLDPHHRGYTEASKALRTFLDSGRAQAFQTYGIQRGELAAAAELTGNTQPTKKHPNVHRDIGAFATEIERVLNSVGLTAEAANNMLDTTQGKYETFWNRIMSGLRDVGARIADAFTPAIDALTRLFIDKDTAKFFRQVGDGIVWLVGGVARLIQGFERLNAVTQGWFGALFAVVPIIVVAVFNPIAGLILAIIALIITAIQSLGDMCGFFEGTGKVIAAIWHNLWGGLADFFNNIILGIKQTFADVVNFFIKGINGITGAYADVKKFLGFGGDAWNPYAISPMGTPPPAPLHSHENVGDAWWQGVDKGRAAGNAARDKIAKWLESAKPLPAGSQPGLKGLGDTGGTVPVKVMNKVNLEDEDLKMLVDLAERKYISHVNATTVVPQVHVHLDNSHGRLDEQHVGEAVKHHLMDWFGASTSLSAAQPAKS